MYDNDYIIAVDENGQPYIAHAFGDRIRAAWGSKSGKRPKFLEKIKTKSGIWRYLYTPEEVRAAHEVKRLNRKGINSTEDLQKYQSAKYKSEQARKRTSKAQQEVKDVATRKAKTAARMAWGSKAGRFIDEHDAGITEAIMRKRLLRKSKKALKNGDKTNAARYTNRAEELRTESARERKAAKESIKNAGKRAVKSIDDLGVDDYIRWKRAQRRGTNSTENLQKYQNAEYQWRNSKIGKRATRKKRSN